MALAGFGTYATVSNERMDLLDRDLLVWDLGDGGVLRKQLQADPLYQQLPVVRDGRVLYVDQEVVSGALSWSSVLSMPYAVRELAPGLAAAIDGMPTIVA